MGLELGSRRRPGLADADRGSAGRSLAELRLACDRHSRDFAELEITAYTRIGGGLAAIEALADLGVHRCTVELDDLGEDRLEGLNRLSREIIDRL